MNSITSADGRPRAPHHFAILCAVVSLSLVPPLCAQEKPAAPSRAATILDSMPRAKRIARSRALTRRHSSRVHRRSKNHRASFRPAVPLNPSLSRAISLSATSPGPPTASARLHRRSSRGRARRPSLDRVPRRHGSYETRRSERQRRSRRASLPMALGSLFSLSRGCPALAGPLQPMTPLSGVIDEKIYEQRIATLDLATDQSRAGHARDVYVYEYDWTPDGQSWIATAAHGCRRCQLVHRASLLHCPRQTGELREIYKPKLQIADPRISPDGKYVAFIEGLMSDEGFHRRRHPRRSHHRRHRAQSHSQLQSVPLCARVDRARPHHRSPQIVDGNSGFGTRQSATGAVRKHSGPGEELLPTRASWMPTTSFSPMAPVTAVVRQSASTPPEVWAGPIGKWKQLTNVNAGVQARLGRDAQCSLDERHHARARLADAAQGLRSRQKLSARSSLSTAALPLPACPRWDADATWAT